jgi:hypothetical protein
VAANDVMYAGIQFLSSMGTIQEPKNRSRRRTVERIGSLVSITQSTRGNYLLQKKMIRMLRFLALYAGYSVDMP